ncbi:MAG: hypothetical protein ACRC41_06720 [Sarcina sp.]
MLKITLTNSTTSNISLSNTKTNKLVGINSVIENLLVTDSDVILSGTFDTLISLENTSILHLDASIHLNNSSFTLKNTSENLKSISISGKLLENEILQIDINPNIYLKINITTLDNSKINLVCLKSNELLSSKIENLSSSKIDLLPQTNSNIILIGHFNNIDFSTNTNISLTLPPNASVDNYQNIQSLTFNSISGGVSNLELLASSTSENIQNFIKSIVYTLNVTNNKALLNIPKSAKSTIDKAYILLNNKSYSISTET